jgi:ABC-type glutathione transport system ATPase component
MSGSVLSVEQLTIEQCSTGQRVVQGVSFSLEPGRVLGIVGESGSGKTLTCKALLGLLPDAFHVAAGRISLAGRDVANFSRNDWINVRGTAISAVFQDPGSYLNPAITVGKQIQEIFTAKQHCSRREATCKVLELFEALALRDPEFVYTQYRHELSGGMLQRVLIASAIALSPQILIADEATTALDVTVQADILDLLCDLKQRTGMALVVVSHDLAVSAQLCDDVLVMKDGAVVEQGPVHQVLGHPTHAYTQLLISEHKTFGLERFLESDHVA